MTSDSTPAFEIEKEALKTEIETGIQSGVDHLEAKTAKRKDADKYHNTRHLLKQYRKVAYAIQISEADMNVRMEMEHGTRLSTLEVNAELAGVDLSGSKLEGYARTVIRSKNMLQIIDNALMIGISKRLLLIPVQHPKYSVRNPSEPLATYILTMRMSLKSSGNIAAAELSIRQPKS